MFCHLTLYFFVVSVISAKGSSSNWEGNVFNPLTIPCFSRLNLDSLHVYHTERNFLKLYSYKFCFVNDTVSSKQLHFMV